jgi:hypothetical protein
MKNPAYEIGYGGECPDGFTAGKFETGLPLYAA